MFYVYVVQNKLGKIYIGQTADIEKRLLRHNGRNLSKASSYTRKNKGPWDVIYKESFNTRRESLNRERYLKSHSGRDWLRETISSR